MCGKCGANEKALQFKKIAGLDLCISYPEPIYHRSNQRKLLEGKQTHLPSTQSYYVLNVILPQAGAELEDKSNQTKLHQLGFYVSAINHYMKQPQDNPTIGLLVCKNKNKNNLVAQYTLDTTNLPIGISEYELNELLPKDFKGLLPSMSISRMS